MGIYKCGVSKADNAAFANWNGSCLSGEYGPLYKYQGLKGFLQGPTATCLNTEAIWSSRPKNKPHTASFGEGLPLYQWYTPFQVIPQLVFPFRLLWFIFLTNLSFPYPPPRTTHSQAPLPCSSYLALSSFLQAFVLSPSPPHPPPQLPNPYILWKKTQALESLQPWFWLQPSQFSYLTFEAWFSELYSENKPPRYVQHPAQGLAQSMRAMLPALPHSPQFAFLFWALWPWYSHSF